MRILHVAAAAAAALAATASVLANSPAMATLPVDAARPSLASCVAKWNRQRIRIDPIPNPNVRVTWKRGACAVSVARLADNFVFTCRINAYATYQCPGHGDDLTRLSVAYRMWNAQINRAGVLRLDPPVPLAHYERREGYILPWNKRGQLFKGLRFIEQQSGQCQVGFSMQLNAPPDSVARCFGSNDIIYDPCFGRTSITSGSIIACAVAPGARAFIRFVVTALA